MAADPGRDRGAGPAGGRRLEPGARERARHRLHPEGKALLDALRAAQSAADWSDLTGTGLRLVGTGTPGWEAEVSGLAGGAPEFLLQSLAIVLHAPDAAVVPEEDVLALLARVWEPDFGDVSDDDVLDALEDEAGYAVGDPVVGRTGYLSPARAALVPDGMEAVRQELPGGGELLSIAAPETARRWCARTSGCARRGRWPRCPARWTGRSCDGGPRGDGGPPRNGLSRDGLSLDGRRRTVTSRAGEPFEVGRALTEIGRLLTVPLPPTGLTTALGDPATGEWTATQGPASVSSRSGRATR